MGDILSFSTPNITTIFEYRSFGNVIVANQLIGTHLFSILKAGADLANVDVFR